MPYNVVRFVVNGKKCRQRRRDRAWREAITAAFFKQIRFGEIGLSLQDCDDLHLSITEQRLSAPGEYNNAHSLVKERKRSMQFTCNWCNVLVTGWKGQILQYYTKRGK